MTPADKKMEEDRGDISQVTVKNAIGAAQKIASVMIKYDADLILASTNNHVSPIFSPALNLTTGMAGVFLEAILQDNDLKFIMHRIDNNRE